MSRVYGKKRDATHAAVHLAFEQCGCLVLDLDGAVDMLVFDVGSGLHLVEAKSGEKSRRTETQKRLLADGWPLEFAWSSETAAALVTEWRRG